jgi:hypothetical protein
MRNRILVIIMALSMIAAFNTGCEKEGTAEKAGKEVDRALDSAKDKYKEMTK